MSRSIHRQMARHQTRKEQALAHYAAMRYGPTVTLADVHPDIQMLFALCMELTSAHDKGDQKTVLEATEIIANFLKRYGTQQKELTTSED